MTQGRQISFQFFGTIHVLYSNCPIYYLLIIVMNNNFLFIITCFLSQSTLVYRFQCKTRKKTIRLYEFDTRFLHLSYYLNEGKSNIIIDPFHK